MQVKLLLTLLFMTILTIIISSGCGGGSGTTQPASLATPTPNMTDNMAYITIKVKWPEQGKAGKLIMSSGNEEKEITASMPNGTNRIDVKVYNFKDKDPDASVVFDPNSFLAGGYVVPPYTTTTIPVPIMTDSNDPNSNILPAIPVKVWAGAFGASSDINDPNSALLSTEHYMILKVGNQTANLQLGDYELTLTANPDTIGGSTVKGSNLISSAIAVPSPAISYITANLNIIYLTPAPNSTSPPKPPKPVKGKSIKFEIIDGNYEGTYLSLSDESGSIVTGQTVTGKTDDDGTSTVTLETDTLESKTVKVKASFEADSNDPNSIYSDYCNVTVIVPPTPTPLPTETPAPTFTPTPTLTPTITPTPTQTPTPPPFPSYVLGTWKELTGDVKETGNTFTVEFTEPYQYKDHLTKVKIIKNGDSNNAYYGWVWYCDESSGQVYWPEDTTSIMPNSESYYTCFGILYKYKSIVPGASSAICWAKKANGTYMCYWSR